MAPPSVSLEHVPFGLVLGEDGKKFKTRSGETVKLMSLLEEALARARADVTARLETEERQASAADASPGRVALTRRPDASGWPARCPGNISQTFTSLCAHRTATPFLPAPPAPRSQELEDVHTVTYRYPPLPRSQESEEFISAVSTAVGIGAVKYADLTMNRNSNYKFSFDKMLSLSGNTAPYMLYAYARIRGIQRRAVERLVAQGDLPSDLDLERHLAGGELVLQETAEINLGRHLLRLPEVVVEVERELLPSKLADYLFDLSGKFNQFYESCPVLQAESAELQRSRLALCKATASVLRLSLGLLGIEPLERL